MIPMGFEPQSAFLKKLNPDSFFSDIVLEELGFLLSLQSYLITSIIITKIYNMKI